MHGRALLLVALSSAPSLARAVPGRLGFTLLTGGGFTSDVFVGAGEGPQGFVQLSPAARLDLSLDPRFKLRAGAEAWYASQQPSGFSSLSGAGSVEIRWLPEGPWRLTLSGGAERGAYSQGAPLDPALVTSPSVSTTTSAWATPLASLSALGLEWRAAALVAARWSLAADGTEVPEHSRALLAGVLWPASPLVSLAATVKGLRTTSPRPDFALEGLALFAVASARLSDDDLVEARLQLQHARFDTTAREDLGRIGLSFTHALSEEVDLEAAYSFAGNATDDPARPTAALHVAFLGLRTRLGKVTW